MRLFKFITTMHFHLQCVCDAALCRQIWGERNVKHPAERRGCTVQTSTQHVMSDSSDGWVALPPLREHRQAPGSFRRCGLSSNTQLKASLDSQFGAIMEAGKLLRWRNAWWYGQWFRRCCWAWLAGMHNSHNEKRTVWLTKGDSSSLEKEVHPSDEWVRFVRTQKMRRIVRQEEAGSSTQSCTTSLNSWMPTI